MLTTDIIKFAQHSVLCWLATVDDTGQPNVSPKEIFAIVDEQHVVIAHIASPGSVKNIGHNPKVCVSLVDVFVQKGFKVYGTVRTVGQQDPDYAHWAAPLLAMAGPKFKVHSVLLVRATRVERIWAPSYQLYPAQTTQDQQIASAMRTYGVVPDKGFDLKRR